jgi:hypothetical protein
VLGALGDLAQLGDGLVLQFLERLRHVVVLLAGILVQARSLLTIK